MTLTTGQPATSLASTSHSRRSTPTTTASSPATLQPDPSLTFPVPYLPARIPLSPPPYRSVSFFVNTFSTSSSPAVSPTTIPTTTRLGQRPLATPFPTGPAPATNWAATTTHHELYERNGRDNNCACPQPFPEANTAFPWGPIAWKASNPAISTKSPAHSADTQSSYVNGSASNPNEHPNPPSQPGRDVLLEQWLRQQARFHTCDDFVNQTDFVPLEGPSGGGCPGPRQMLQSGVLAAFPGRRGS
jgi:hypothetical protein